MSIAHDFLSQDAQVSHALAKKSSTRDVMMTASKNGNNVEVRICFDQINLSHIIF